MALGIGFWVLGWVGRQKRKKTLGDSPIASGAIDCDEDEAANTGHSRAESNQTRDLL